MSERPAVLIVEDDFETRTLFCVIAQREGFEVLAAEDGAEALALLGREEVDVILLDLLLPKVNGFEVLRRLRCARPELLARTIVITAAPESATRDCENLLHVFCLRREPMDVTEIATDLTTCARMQRQPPHSPASRQRAG